MISNKNFDSKTKELKKQIEYYLSDENLKKDDFFHKKISSSPDVNHLLSQLIKKRALSISISLQNAIKSKN